MEIKKYKSTDTIEYDNLAYINDYLFQFYMTKIKEVFHWDPFIPYPEYTYTVFSLNEVLTSTKFNKINKGIQDFRDYYFTPEGWKDLKVYENINNVTVSQINDWYTDLKLIDENYRDMFNHNIWNICYLLKWNEDSTIVVEWED